MTTRFHQPSVAYIPGRARLTTKLVGIAFSCLLALQSGALASSFRSRDENVAFFSNALSVEATCGAFINLSINGGQFAGNGCHIQVRNTSWEDPEAPPSERHRDGDSRWEHGHGGLSPAARAAIRAGQPYGVYELELEMAAGSMLLSAPSVFDVWHEDEHGDSVEIELEIELGARASGLLFDPAAAAAGAISPLFPDPETYVWDFFVSTTSSDASQVGENDGDSDSDSDSDSDRGIGVEAEFAWAMGGLITDEFGDAAGELSGNGLEIENAVIPSQLVPEPSTRLLLTLGLGVLALGVQQRR